jgi:hypothetical protein
MFKFNRVCAFFNFLDNRRYIEGSDNINDAIVDKTRIKRVLFSEQIGDKITKQNKYENQDLDVSSLDLIEIKKNN